MRFLLAIVFIIGLSNSVLAAQNLKGELQLSRGSLSLLGADGSRHELQPGSIDLTYSSTGFSSWFTGARQIKISQGALSGTVMLKSSKFSGFNSFDTGAATGQSFGIRGEEKLQPIRSYEQQASHSCFYSGYCTACGVGVSINGEATTDCSFKYNLNCTGFEDVLEQVTEYQTQTIVTFYNLDEHKPLATVTSQPQVKQKTEILKFLSGCH